MKAVDFVVEAVVFAVGPLRPHRVGLKPGMLNRIVVALLGRPFQIVAEIVDFDLGALKFLMVGGKIGRHIVERQSVLLDQLCDRNASQGHLRQILQSKIGLVPQGLLVVGDRVSIFGLVLAVKDQGNFIPNGQLRRKVLLSQDERLKGMQQVLNRQSGQQSMHAAIRLECDIVESSDFDPIAKILNADVCIEYGRPGNRQRMHAVLVFQDVRRVCAVLAAASRDKAVIRTIVSTIAIEEADKFAFPPLPVDVFLPLRHSACIADTFVVKLERPMAMFLSVFKLDGRGWSLIGHHAARAILNLRG